jgi:hypothetical protein
VHGTWPRGLFFQLFPALRFLGRAKRTPCWFERGSNFRIGLCSKLKDKGTSYKFIVHEWSGANSILARAKAAKDLAARLRALSVECPNAKQIVIAHSHGGNIVRLALEHLPNPGCVFVVTMGTPFMEVYPSLFIQRNATRMYTALGYSFAAIAGHLATALENVWIQVFGIGLYMIIIFPLLLLLVNYGRRAAIKLSELTKGGMLWPSSVEGFVIRAIDDEASLALAAGTVSNKLLLALGILLIPFSTRSVAFYLLVLVAIILMSLAAGPVWLESDIGLIVWFALPGAAVIITVLLASGCMSVYGRELLLTAVMCQVNSDSVPDINPLGSIDVFTFPDVELHTRGFRHSIYDNLDCVDLIDASLPTRRPM